VLCDGYLRGHPVQAVIPPENDIVGVASSGAGGAIVGRNTDVMDAEPEQFGLGEPVPFVRFRVATLID
jgi:hypothetical protein